MTSFKTRQVIIFLFIFHLLSPTSDIFREFRFSQSSVASSAQPPQPSCIEQNSGVQALASALHSWLISQIDRIHSGNNFYKHISHELPIRSKKLFLNSSIHPTLWASTQPIYILHKILII